MSAGRLLFPRNSSPEHEAAMIAITARLRPIAESPTVRLVEVTYWRDGLDMPLVTTVYDTHTVGRWRHKAPIEATHLTIEERGWPSRPPWRFDVPEVPARVTAVEDNVGWIWLREGAAWLLWRGAAGVPAGTGVFAYRLHDGDLVKRAPLVECPDPRKDQG